MFGDSFDFDDQSPKFKCPSCGMLTSVDENECDHCCVEFGAGDLLRVNKELKSNMTGGVIKGMIISVVVIVVCVLFNN
ncbi:hypothetical protein [Pseudoteredinibacter isoporae]|uniref:Putative membrane protein YvbJ n=1 Tax=Pseudoteredinibacter isoporae TaxID=570281 RepID=A0A7X0JV33_9GAMM|nr:hypothetical protein [Pseudoteredinibacter isoporae]MBB6522822.1 putative membrane protein YvbJ [Pseudoteredinibacter isoporae]NHO88349.1 hypothetical protein [Pseudoteredinibacter isoporae]NIB23320.1 hypothetical protein [Pseudoteredinibacter isoporae]